MKRKKIEASPSLPSSHLIALREAGFTVIEYLNKFLVVADADGNTYAEWLPRLAIASGATPREAYRVIEWLPKGHPANAYSFNGWKVQTQFSGGGMYQEIGQALGWFKWIDDQRAKGNG